MSPFPTNDIVHILLNGGSLHPLRFRVRGGSGCRESGHTPSSFSSEQDLVTWFRSGVLYWGKAIDQNQQNSESFDNFSSLGSLVFFLKHRLSVALFQELNHKKICGSALLLLPHSPTECLLGLRSRRPDYMIK